MCDCVPRHTDIDMIIIREQTEGEYTSLEHEVCIDDIAIDSILLFYHLKQIDFIQLWVCTVITHRGCQSVIRLSVTHSAAPHVLLFCSHNV